MFVCDFNGEILDTDANQYLESIKTCQNCIEDIIDNSNNTRTNNSSMDFINTNQGFPIHNKTNYLLERINNAKLENSLLMKEAKNLFIENV